MNNEVEIIHEFNSDAYEVFKRNGEQDAVKVRRILQITKDLAECSFQALRILDLGCGEGVYAIEAALRGADVVAIDGRTERMEQGRSICVNKGISNISFFQEDVRNISKESLGEFDVVYFLGLLYHLDAADIFMIMPKLYDICKRFMIIDTHIALEGKNDVLNGNIRYHGIKVKEHQETDKEKIISALASSLGNIYSFWFTKESLLRLLKEIGFTTVLECYVPFEPGEGKAKGDRITLVAVKGVPVKVSSYPWINNMTENAIIGKMKELGSWQPYWVHPVEVAKSRIAKKNIIKQFMRVQIMIEKA